MQITFMQTIVMIHKKKCEGLMFCRMYNGE